MASRVPEILLNPLLILHRLRRPAGHQTLSRCPVGLQPTDKFRGESRDPLPPPLVPPRRGPRLPPGKRKIGHRRKSPCFLLQPTADDPSIQIQTQDTSRPSWPGSTWLEPAIQHSREMLGRLRKLIGCGDSGCFWNWETPIRICSSSQAIRQGLTPGSTSANKAESKFHPHSTRSQSGGSRSITLSAAREKP